MPYTPQHKQRSRERILESAYRMFITMGYAGTSIDEVMAQAKLTRGAFYAHFESKQQLYQEAIRHAAETSYLAERKPSDLDAVQWLNHLFDLYLSESHVRLEGRPCPLASLTTDMASREPGVRAIYTHSFKGFNKYIDQSLGRDADLNHDTLALSVMMIGAVAIARAVEDDALSREILASCRELAATLLEEAVSIAEN